MSNNRASILLTATDQTKGAFASASRNLQDLNGKVGGLASTLRLFSGAGLAGGLGGVLGAVGAQQFIRSADAVTVLNNQLKLATGSASAAQSAYSQLFDVAQRSRVSFTELGATYAAIARNSSDLGLSQKQLLTVTEAIGNAMTISGGPAEGMNAALVQLTQGLASGTLRGEELNSVMEQTPRLAKALADGLGVTIGQLREMGKAGELTAEKVVTALQGQADVLRNEVATATVTVAQSMTLLENASIRVAGSLDKSIGVTRGTGAALKGLSNDLTVIGDAIDASAQRGEGGFLQLANAAGVVAGRTGFGAVQIAANTLNGTINFLTGGVLGLNDQLDLMPDNLKSTGDQVSIMESKLKAAQKEYDRLSQILGSAPDNVYVRSEINALAQYIAALKAAQREKAALGGVTAQDPSNYGNEGAREKSRQDGIKRQAESRAALEKFMGDYASANERLAAEIKKQKALLGEFYSPEVEKRIRDKFTAKSGGGSRASQQDPYQKGNSYLDGLKSQLQATEELTVYEKLLADIRSGSLGKLTPQLQAQLEQTAKLIDADKELVDVTKQFAELEAENAKQRKALKDEGKSFYDATRTPIERLNIELGRQAELLKKLGPAYKDTAMRASEAAQDRYDAETKTTAAISELDQFTQRAAQNIQDYLGNSFQQLMEGNFSNIGDAFTQMLNNMVAQAAAAGLARELLGDLAQGGTSSGLFGGFLKDVVGSFGGFRAAGGPVQSGKGYVVGENGPEWFEPATSGMVVPNHALQGGGTSHNYSINVSMPSGASRSTGQQFGREIARQLSIANARNG